MMLFRVHDKISSSMPVCIKMHLKNRKLAELFTDTSVKDKVKANRTENSFSDSLINVYYLPTRSRNSVVMICTGHPYQLKTYLNLTSLHKHSITVAPPKECPIIAILHKSMEF